MRDLSDEFKLSVRSISEVFEALSILVARIAPDKSIRFHGGTKIKKPTKAAVVSALLLWVDSQPLPEQKRVISEGMRKLNLLLAETDEERSIFELDAPPASPAARPGKIVHRGGPGGKGHTGG